MFDPFGDFKTRGYLRNLRGYKSASAVKKFEHAEYVLNIGDARTSLLRARVIDYKVLCSTHRRLFGSVYPWAGKDRLAVTPDSTVRKGRVLFAPPQDIRRATETGLKLGNDAVVMAKQSGLVMGYLAFAHPFLEGNGRALLAVHTELARRAAISIDWRSIDHRDYLRELTKEIMLPGDGSLDAFLAPFVRANPQQAYIPDDQPRFTPR